MHNVLPIVVSIIVCVLSLFVTAEPNFPSDWTANVEQNSITWTGGSYNATSGQACCAIKAPQCQVKALGESVTEYVDGSMNASLLTNGVAGVLSLYEKKKVMQVVRSKTGKGWHCQTYCKVSKSDWVSPLAFLKGAKDMGSVVMNGKTLEKYVAYDGIGPKIHMERLTYYVDQSNPKQSIPYEEVDQLIPFNGPEISEAHIVYNGFKAGKPDPSLFIVDNLDSCEKDSKSDCDDDVRGSALRFLASVSDKKTVLYHSAKAAGRKVSPQKVTNAHKSKYKWPTDWSSVQSIDVVQNQGGYEIDGGQEACCKADYFTQCQVQSQYRIASSYHDVTHNRSRIEDPAMGVTVSDYNALKLMTIHNNGTDDVCYAYCPIDPSDTIGTGPGEFLPDDASDDGATTWRGKPAHAWSWNQTLFGIKMGEVTFYADVSGPDLVPLSSMDIMTPYGGPKIGVSNVTFQTFKPGTPPASKFNIKDVESCQLADNCGDPEWQSMRLQLKQYYSFSKYVLV